MATSYEPALLLEQDYHSRVFTIAGQVGSNGRPQNWFIAHAGTPRQQLYSSMYPIRSDGLWSFIKASCPPAKNGWLRCSTALAHPDGFLRLELQKDRLDRGAFVYKNGARRFAILGKWGWSVREETEEEKKAQLAFRQYEDSIFDDLQ
jgi:hypothetical protein